MRNGFLGSLLVLLAGAGVAAAQSYYPAYPAYPAPAYPGWQAPPQAGYYNPNSVPGQQAYPTWPSSQTQGANYTMPYQGQPQLPAFGGSPYSNPAGQGYQPMPPMPNPSAAPQMGSSLPPNPPSTAAVSPTPPTSTAQPVIKMDAELEMKPRPARSRACPSPVPSCCRTIPWREFSVAVAPPRPLVPSHENQSALQWTERLPRLRQRSGAVVVDQAGGYAAATQRRAAVYAG